MGRIRKILIAVLITAGLFGLTTCNNNLTTALIDKIAKEKSEIPIPGDGGVLATTVGMENITVSWTKGSDNKTPVSSLEYMVVYSGSDNISSLAGAEANGTSEGAWAKDIATFDVTGLLDNYPYWVNVIIRDGSGNKAVYSAKANTTVKHPRIYWTDAGTQTIQCSDLNGDNVENVITSGLTTPFAISVDPGARKIYWADSGTTPPKIKRSDFDGSNVEELITSGLNQPFGIAVDYINSYLFWTDAFNDAVYRSPLPPLTTDTIVYELLNNTNDGVDAPRGIDVDMQHGYFYWSEMGTAKRIRKSSFDGTTKTTLVNFLGGEQVTDVAVLSGSLESQTMIYFLDRLNHNVQSSNQAGTVSDLIDTGLNTPNGITVDSTSETIFWVDQIIPGIYGYDLNQGSPTKIAADYLLGIAGVNNPRGIDIY